MEPAHPLVLTPQEHALLGETIEIMGQVESILITTVGRLLGVDGSTARQIMGSTQVRNNVATWAHVVRNRSGAPEIIKWVQEAETLSADVSADRNAFIHALYVPDYVEPGYVEPGYQTTSATKIRSGTSRPTSELRKARDSAAKLSCVVAHIDHQTKAPEGRGPSPWLERLGSLPEAHRQSRKARRRGKGREPPP